MREIFRVLKPGGWAILQVPIDTNRHTTLEDDAINTPKYYWQKDHLRPYGSNYPNILEEIGFQYVQYDRKEVINTYEEQYCQLSDEPLYIFYK